MTKMTLRASARRTADNIHRWLGFVGGAVLIVAGLTGTLLAFYMEIDGSVNPLLKTSAPHARPASYEAVYRKLSTLPVAAAGYWKIEQPPGGGPITSRYYEALPGGMSRTRMVTLDPVSLRVMRDAHWQETFFTWIYDLHMNLLFGPPGKIAMGIFAVAMIFMLISGLANWALPKGRIAAKLRFKRNASTARRTYDLHKLIGLFSVPLLILTVGTAAMISLPYPVRPILDAFSPLKPSPTPKSSGTIKGQRIPIDTILSRAASRFPGSATVWIRVPAAAADLYDLQIRQAGDPMTRFPRTHLWIDQYSGRILAVRDPHRDAAGDTVLNWLVPLHDGKAFGMIGRILVMMIGLTPSILLATGIMRWQQKRRAAALVRVRRAK
ncbi:MAG: hypothetical protein JWL66_2786 [Sphingomonadales bacterium]|nr:hypothetical protein [Sphingomonadales bacterium]